MISSATAPAVVRRREIPEELRRLSAMAETDYVDLFTAPAAPPSQARSPVQWLRAVLYDAPLRVRLVLVGALLTQRAVLRMRSPWRIADSGGDWVRLEASSSLLTGHIVLRREQHQVSMATFVRYESRAAQFVWPPVSTLHRSVARVLVRNGSRVG